MPVQLTVLWNEDMDPKDIDAAYALVSLLMKPKDARKFADGFLDTPKVWRRPRDILHAARKEPIPIGDADVKKHLDKIAQGIPLDPILVMRGNHKLGLRALICDGYHRLSAAYWIDESQEIPVYLQSGDDL